MDKTEKDTKNANHKKDKDANYVKNYIKDGNTSIKLITLGSLFAILLLALSAYKIWEMRPRPVVFVADKQGQVLKQPSLDIPYLDNSEVLNWVNNNIRQFFTLNYINHNDVALKHKNKFLNSGYQDYLKVLATDNILSEVLEKRTVVTCTADAAPEVLKQGVVKNAFTWSVKLPVRLALEGNTNAQKRVKNLTLIIKRVVITNQYPDGLKIQRIALTD